MDPLSPPQNLSIPPSNFSIYDMGGYSESQVIPDQYILSKIYEGETWEARPLLFSEKPMNPSSPYTWDNDDLIAGLYEQIGRFQTELDYMKKKVTTDH